MVTDAQVRLLRKKRMQGTKLEVAAAAAGMSERTARTWASGPLPSQTKKTRAWRTREDPFADVWESVIEPLLVADEDGGLEAKTVFAELVRLHPGRFESGQVRTLQRRFRLWRAQHGPAKPVFFPQVHSPGRTGSIDFTHATELGVTISGVAFAHMFFHLVMPFSGWHVVSLAFSETFEALTRGLQHALIALGGVPERLRMDNLSAATHELRETGGRTLTTRFRAVLEHFGLESSRIQPGEAHENGVVEKGHDVLKSALDQALRLRESRDFSTTTAYLAFVEEVIERVLHAGRSAKIAEERAHLRPLPSTKLPEYTRIFVEVRRWSTIQVLRRTYSVPARLIGHQVEVLLYADFLEVRHAGKVMETIPRLRGISMHRIDYRHVIWSLVRKPGAFAHYRYREDLFPSLVFRRAYDALRERRGDRADVEYVRVLHLAASTGEALVERSLEQLLESGAAWDYAAVKALAQPETPAIPSVHVGTPDLAEYDRLLSTEVAS
jgi:transposase